MTTAHPTRADDIRVWKTRAYQGKRGTTYGVRWRVNGREHHKTFATAKLAEIFRSNIVVGARRGDHFDERSGLPTELAPPARTTTWLEHLWNFMDVNGNRPRWRTSPSRAPSGPSWTA